jgi:hypothetical protein
MQQAVSVLVGENDERLCGRETIQDLNAFSGRRPECAPKIIGRLDRDATLKNRRSQSVRLGAGVAGRLSRLGERFAIGLRLVLSRDSAMRPGSRFPLPHGPDPVRSRNGCMTQPAYPTGHRAVPTALSVLLRLSLSLVDPHMQRRRRLALPSGSAAKILPMRTH